MLLYQLNKTVLQVSNQPEKLLVGLTTNTSDATKNAFVDRFGKTIATADQIKKSDDEMLLVVSPHCLQQLYTHLKQYLSLTETQIKQDSHFVYYDTDNSYSIKENEYALPQKKGQIILTKEKQTTQSEE